MDGRWRPERPHFRQSEVVRCDHSTGLQMASYSANVNEQSPRRLIWPVVPVGRAMAADAERPVRCLRENIFLKSGNCYYTGAVRRASQRTERGVKLLDMGT